MILDNDILSKFQKFDGSRISDVVGYVNAWLMDYPDGKVAVGTDSIELGRTTIYATAVALFYPSPFDDGGYGRGAHVIYSKFKTRKKMDMWTRLWNEVEFTRIVAHVLEEDSLLDFDQKFEVHVDINPSDEHRSERLYSSAMGYFKGMGYHVIAKPDSWVAKCAADSIVR